MRKHMATAARTQQQVDEDGIILTPEEEAELEQAIAESDEDEREGRVFTLEEVLAELRKV